MATYIKFLAGDYGKEEYIYIKIKISCVALQKCLEQRNFSFPVLPLAK